MNLLKVAEKLANGDSGGLIVSLNSDSCLHQRDIFSDCDRCHAICPVGAIKAGKPPRLEVESCAACMACLPVCPVGAFAGDDAVQDLLRCAARLDNRQVEILCTHGARLETAGYGTPDTVAIEISGCLAGLGVGGCLALLAQGVERIYVRTNACADCPWSALSAQVESQVLQAQRWLEAWERCETVVLVPDVDKAWPTRPLYKSSAPPVSRRDLLRGFGHKETHSDSIPVPDGKFPLRERLRLLTALQQWPTPEDLNLGDADRRFLNEAGFCVLTIDNTCSACGACARACAAGALQMEMEDGQFRLTFVPEACIGCDICVHICLEQAIYSEHLPPLGEVFGQEEVLIVHAGRYLSCSRCRAPFVPAEPESRICPLCEFRRKHPFGAQAPAGLLRRKQKPHAGET